MPEMIMLGDAVQLDHWAPSLRTCLGAIMACAVGYNREKGGWSVAADPRGLHVAFCGTISSSHEHLVSNSEQCFVLLLPLKIAPKLEVWSGRCGDCEDCCHALGDNCVAHVYFGTKTPESHPETELLLRSLAAKHSLSS